MYSFIWKNEDSYEDYGIIINKFPALSVPERQLDEIEVLGRNGNLVVDYGTYKDIDFTFQCTLKDFSRIDGVKAWLTGFDKLIMSWIPDKYYKARLINRIDIAQSLEEIGEFPLIFKAEPFGYAVNNSLITVTSPDSIINNPGTFEADPVIKIYGSGNVDLSINNSVVHLIDIADYITMDSVLQDCYKDTVLCNSQMYGEFLELQPGSNNISWTGSVSRIEITPNWRYL